MLCSYSPVPAPLGRPLLAGSFIILPGILGKFFQPPWAHLSTAFSTVFFSRYFSKKVGKYFLHRRSSNLPILKGALYKSDSLRECAIQLEYSILMLRLWSRFWGQMGNAVTKAPLRQALPTRAKRQTAFPELRPEGGPAVATCPAGTRSYRTTSLSVP